MYFVHEKEREKHEIKGIEGVFRKFISKGNHIQVVHFEVKGGTHVPEEAHPEEQAGYVIKGKFEVNIGGVKGILEQGHYYWIPSNMPHSGFVHEDTVFIDIYSPPR
jgi:quercetin dioxygenase-like cupin family protein